MNSPQSLRTTNVGWFGCASTRLTTSAIFQLPYWPNATFGPAYQRLFVKKLDTAFGSASLICHPVSAFASCWTSASE